MKSYYKVDKSFRLIKSRSKKNENWKTNKSKKLLLSAASLNIGIYLITPLLLGVFIGYNIDRFLDTKPLFTLISIIIGSISSFYNLVKLTKEN
jgi:F0F1-type ATP synthase assembly protein I